MFCCAFTSFCRVFTCRFYCVPVCVNMCCVCVLWRRQQNNGKILINYSCLFGPYTSFWALRMPSATFANEIIRNSGWILFDNVYFSHCKIYIALERGIHSSAPLNNGNSSSMAPRIPFLCVEHFVKFLVLKTEGKRNQGKIAMTPRNERWNREEKTVKVKKKMKYYRTRKGGNSN